MLVEFGFFKFILFCILVFVLCIVVLDCCIIIFFVEREVIGWVFSGDFEIDINLFFGCGVIFKGWLLL